MSKSGSRYGRRSNWFKIHCLLQEQQGGNGAAGGGAGAGGGVGSANSANLDQLARLQQASHQARQTYQDKTNPCIKSATAATSPCSLTLSTQAATATATATATGTAAAASPSPGLPGFLQAAKYLNEQRQLKLDSRLSNTPSDSGASSAGDATDNGSIVRLGQAQDTTSGTGGGYALSSQADIVERQQQRRHKELLDIFRSHSEPLYSSFTPFSLRPASLVGGSSGMAPLPMFKSELLFPFAAASPAEEDEVADDDDEERERERERERMAASLDTQEPIDLSLRSRTDGISPLASSSSSPLGDALPHSRRHQLPPSGANSSSPSPAAFVRKTTPLDLTLVRSQTLTG